MEINSCRKLAIIPVIFLTVSIIGCAANTGGGQVLSTVDSGLTTIEQSAQAGRQAITMGTSAASGMATAPGQYGLIDILMQQLGISQQQAMGGTGAIFQLAQAGMTPQDFSVLPQSVPGLNEMLNAAPVVSNPLAGMGSGASSMLGNAGSTLNNAASLAASFQQLNLSPDMVGQFIPIVTNYVSNTSGQATASLLNSALSIR